MYLHISNCPKYIIDQNWSQKQPLQIDSILEQKLNCPWNECDSETIWLAPPGCIRQCILFITNLKAMTALCTFLRWAEAVGVCVFYLYTRSSKLLVYSPIYTPSAIISRIEPVNNELYEHVSHYETWYADAIPVPF